MSAAEKWPQSIAPLVLELAARLDSLDYYALLGIPDGWSSRVDYVRLREAYQQRVEAVHPDRFAVGGAGAEVLTAAGAVYKRLGEAITVVGDPLLRPLYDQERRRGRLRLDPMQAADILTAELRQIHHVFARYYAAKANESISRGDWSTAQQMVTLGLACQNAPALQRLRQAIALRDGRNT